MTRHKKFILVIASSLLILFTENGASAQITDETDINDLDVVATPLSRTQESQFHTVIVGDTLTAISMKYYRTSREYTEIFEANKPMLKDPDNIYPGQVLRIPSRQEIKR